MDKSAGRQRKTEESKTFALKAQLKDMLAQPLVARGISTRYITSGSRPIVDDLLSGESMYSCWYLWNLLLTGLVFP
jgi:ATP-dependent RNA helicase DDX24/MAK5